MDLVINSGEVKMESGAQFGYMTWSQFFEKGYQLIRGQLPLHHPNLPKDPHLFYREFEDSSWTIAPSDAQTIELSNVTIQITRNNSGLTLHLPRLFVSRRKPNYVLV